MNAGGARLWHSIDGVSSSTLATKFLEAFQDEIGSVKTEKVIYCVYHKQDGPQNVHHGKLFGFPFSENSCAWECELVVTLFKALVSRADLRQRLTDVDDLENKVHEIEENWGSSYGQDQRLILSLGPSGYMEITVKLLQSFPAPVLDPREISMYSVLPKLKMPKGLNEMSLLALASVYGRPQGEIIRLSCKAVTSSNGWVDGGWMTFRVTRSPSPHINLFSLFYNYDQYVALLGKVSVVRRQLP